jgi:hypothetical protein
MNAELERSALLLFDTLARVCFAPEFLDVIPYLPALLKANNQTAFSLILVMSCYPQSMAAFVRLGIPDIVQSMSLSRKFDVYRNDFLARCGQPA